MSYILEALKQAEEERGSDRLSKKVLSAQPVEDEQQNSVDWKKWLTIAIFINAVVLFVWIAWKFVSITLDSEVNNESVQSELPSSVNATATIDEPTETIASVETTMTKEEQTPAIAEPIESQVSAIVPEKVQQPSMPPLEISESEVDTVVEEKIIPSKIVAPKVAKPTPLPEDFEQALVLEKPSLSPPATKSTKPVIAAPVIKAEIITPKVEPLPATPREQLGIESEQEIVNSEPEIVEPEMIEPEVVEQIAVVQRPPVPEFAELPYSLQQQIPEIRISVHIYNSEPQQRKVRINGKIFREGDEVERNLFVEEVTPRGVIFDYDQTVFRLNLH